MSSSLHKEPALYWIFEKALDDNICEKILSLGKNEFKKAKIGYGSSGSDDKKIRDSSIVWLSEQWVFDMVFSYMNVANKNAGWEIDVDAAESMQFTKYKKKGFYSFHKDGGGFETYNKPGNTFLHNKSRKLSMTALLNDEFEGGGFEFYNVPELKMNKGDIVFFPSFELHRVNPVTKGVRHSLVTWFVGPKFK